MHDINAIDDIRMQETGDAQDVMEIEVQGKEVRFFFQKRFGVRKPN
mgnify:FL=1